ncbi:MAG: UxaA family hydrolase [Syntrophomonadaceae bacterium]|nr:UxaA family hydrolase [Syntrophomonadaceae bacterium]
METRRALIISAKDNVATALQEVEAGCTVAARLGREEVQVQAREKIPFGFKVALWDILKAGDIYKYGEVIGRASCDIKEDDLVHVHNVEGIRGRGDLEAGGDRR